MGGKRTLASYAQGVEKNASFSRAIRPSWPAMIGATLVAAVVASVIDLAIQFWLTPFGWSAGVAFGLFAIGALIGFLVSAALGVVVGLPLGRLLARQGKFEPASLIIVGALLGVLAATIFSALGNTYVSMSGIGFWKSFVVDGTMGALIGHFWWVFEKRSLRRG